MGWYIRQFKRLRLNYVTRLKSLNYAVTKTKGLKIYKLLIINKKIILLSWNKTINLMKKKLILFLLPSPQINQKVKIKNIIQNKVK